MGYLGNRPTAVPLTDADIVSVNASKLTGTIAVPVPASVLTGQVAVNQGGTAATTQIGGYDSLTGRGADIASASTINLDTATGDTVDVTGTTGITAITLSDGSRRIVRFTEILTLTHSSSLILPGGVNITTASGDFAEFIGYNAGVIRCISYTPISGTSIVTSAVFPDFLLINAGVI